MSRENVEVVRGIFAAFSRGGEESLRGLDFCDPAVEMQDFPAFPDSEWHHGHEGVVDWALKLWRVAYPIELEPTEFIEAPDERLLVRYDIRAQAKRSGIPVQAEGYAVFTFRDDKILRAAAYRTRAEALEAVGLRE